MNKKDLIEKTEMDSDGAWIYLVPGFQLDGVHSIHEDTMTQAKKLLSQVKPCTCKDCKTGTRSVKFQESF